MQLICRSVTLDFELGDCGDRGNRQLVPQSRGADDGFACILGRDPATVAVFEEYSQPRAPRAN